MGIWLLLIVGQIFHAQCQRFSIPVIENSPSEDSKKMFMEAFLPYLKDLDVVSLQYAKEGGREPIYIAHIVVNEAGMAKIIQNTKVDEHREYFGFFYSFKSQFPQHLINRVNWWNFDKTLNYEQRIWEFSPDHFANLCCGTKNNECYIMAVVH